MSIEIGGQTLHSSVAEQAARSAKLSLRLLQPHSIARVKQNIAKRGATPNKFYANPSDCRGINTPKTSS